MRDFLHHFFLPHHANNHRSKALHHNTLSIVIVLLLGLAFLLPPLRHNYPSVLGISYNISTKDLLELTNKKRAEEGLVSLVLNDQLTKAAQDKAQYMFEKNFWAHVAPDGTTPWYFIKNSGYEYQYAGENLARGFSTSSDVVNAWMASPTHRENMLSPNYNDIGFAVAAGSLTGSDTILVVEEFGSRYNPNEDTSVKNQKPPLKFLKTQEVTQNQGHSAVAALSNKPLIDSKSTTRYLTLGFLILFIVILLIDLIIIERKKITRTASHNLDHIIFLLGLLLAAIIIGGGIIL